MEKEIKTVQGNNIFSGKRHLLSRRNRVKIMAEFVLFAITLTACSQGGSVEKESKEIENEETEILKADESKIEISMEEAISIGRGRR